MEPPTSRCPYSRQRSWPGAPGEGTPSFWSAVPCPHTTQSQKAITVLTTYQEPASCPWTSPRVQRCRWGKTAPLSAPDWLFSGDPWALLRRTLRGSFLPLPPSVAPGVLRAAALPSYPSGLRASLPPLRVALLPEALASHLPAPARFPDPPGSPGRRLAHSRAPRRAGGTAGEGRRKGAPGPPFPSGRPPPSPPRASPGRGAGRVPARADPRAHLRSARASAPEPLGPRRGGAGAAATLRPGDRCKWGARAGRWAGRGRGRGKAAGARTGLGRRHLRDPKGCHAGPSSSLFPFLSFPILRTSAGGVGQVESPAETSPRKKNQTAPDGPRHPGQLSSPLLCPHAERSTLYLVTFSLSHLSLYQENVIFINYNGALGVVSPPPRNSSSSLPRLSQPCCLAPGPSGFLMLSRSLR